MTRFPGVVDLRVSIFILSVPNMHERDDDLELVTATLILTGDALDVRSYTHVVPLSLCSSNMELRVQPAHRPSLLRRARSTRNSR